MLRNPGKKNAITLRMYRQIPSAVAAATDGACASLSSRASRARARSARGPTFRVPRVRATTQQAAAYSRDEPPPLKPFSPSRTRSSPAYTRATAGLPPSPHHRPAILPDDACLACPAKLGIGYLAFMDLLVGAVGPQREPLFTARVVGGRGARLGLVSAVLPKAELDAHVDAWPPGLPTPWRPCPSRPASKSCVLREHGGGGQKAVDRRGGRGLAGDSADTRRASCVWSVVPRCLRDGDAWIKQGTVLA